MLVNVLTSPCHFSADEHQSFPGLLESNFRPNQVWDAQADISALCVSALLQIMWSDLDSVSSFTPAVVPTWAWEPDPALMAPLGMQDKHGQAASYCAKVEKQSCVGGNQTSKSLHICSITTSWITGLIMICVWVLNPPGWFADYLTNHACSDWLLLLLSYN